MTENCLNVIYHIKLRQAVFCQRQFKRRPAFLVQETDLEGKNNDRED